MAVQPIEHEHASPGPPHLAVASPDADATAEFQIIVFIATPVSSQLNGFKQICAQNLRNMPKKNLRE